MAVLNTTNSDVFVVFSTERTIVVVYATILSEPKAASLNRFS